jgi:sulfide:quinone oxidoreductase
MDTEHRPSSGLLSNDAVGAPVSENKTVVVLGGGVGGLVAASTLRKKLPNQHRVVLVERERNHLFAPSLLWLITGKRTRRQISRPLARLSRTDVEIVQGEIERIDPHARRIQIVESTPNGPNTREIEADYLVVSLGAELDEDAIPGLAQAGHSFYTVGGSESLRDALEKFTGSRVLVLTATPAYKCPAAPYEAAMLINAHLRKRHRGEEARVDIYTAEPVPLGVAGPEVSAGVRDMITSAGIGHFPDHQVVSVEPGERRVDFADGVTADFDLLAYVPPHRAPRVVREARLVDDSGWVPVDRNTLHTSFPGVYAIGDITSIPLVMGKPLPKAGVFAEREAKVVAHNIANEIVGKSDQTVFTGHGECFIETGSGKAGFGRGDFYAEPAPQIALRKPGIRWHLAKVLFEKNWLRRRF